MSARGRDDAANERLEFLGDRVLGLIVADAIYRRWPKEREGAMGKRLAHLVSRETCAVVARAIGLGAQLTVRLSRAEMTAGAIDRVPLLADALEAVIAALYLDGGLEVARRFVLGAWEPILAGAGAPPRDAKGALQEWAMARALPLPIYGVVAETGPAHAKRFTIEVRVERAGVAQGEGATKRAAEMAAAAELSRRIGIADG